jgi:prephenate dehydratase
MSSIAYQGEPGANSHIACVDNYPDLNPLPCATFEDAFAAVEDGTAELGMIPIENSIAGRVADIHSLLPASGLHIVGETFLPIHFQLLAVSGAKIEELRTVHSHIHALGQCRNIIRRYKLKPVVGADTAGSAREVAEWADKSRAALATRLAGQIYGLQTLVPDVEDEAHNTTRFIVLSKDARWAACEGPVVTTFVFRVRNVLLPRNADPRRLPGPSLPQRVASSVGSDVSLGDPRPMSGVCRQTRTSPQKRYVRPVVKETGLAVVLIQLEAEMMPSGGPTLIPDALPVALATLCFASKKTPQCWLNM